MVVTMRHLPAFVCLALVACGGTTASSSTDVTEATATSTAPAADPAATEPTASSVDSPVDSTVDTGGGTILNVWSGPSADLTALPIGTDLVSTEAAAVGGLFVCDAGNPNGGGAFAVGPWIDEAAGTWDLTSKVSVQGEVSWEMAEYSETLENGTRRIVSNGLPVDTITGVFPIAADDPAYSYDRNPNSIAEASVDLSLPANPTAAATPACLPKGAVGVFRNGVVAFASVDATNRDAVAYETQDSCDGHPEVSSTYHYHDVPSCLLNATVGSSTVIGFANDGFPIVVERDEAGNLPTNADLDECHGRTSSIELGGEIVEVYHYSATYEFPYFIGCYRGTPVV